MKKTSTILVILLGALWLAACGSPAEPAAAPPAVEEPPQAAEPAPTSAPVEEAAAVTAPFDVYSLPAGVTEEGAFFIGNPDAPVTMSDYSNFL